MAKLRLGVGFEGMLYPEGLGDTEAPSLRRDPAPGALSWLISAAAHFHVIVYSTRRTGRAAEIRGWLLTMLLRHFDYARHPDATAAALQALAVIDVADQRVIVDIAHELPAIAFAGIDQWPSIAEMEAVARRHAAVGECHVA